MFRSHLGGRNDQPLAATLVPRPSLHVPPIIPHVRTSRGHENLRRVLEQPRSLQSTDQLRPRLFPPRGCARFIASLHGEEVLHSVFIWSTKHSGSTFARPQRRSPEKNSVDGESSLLCPPARRHKPTHTLHTEQKPLLSSLESCRTKRANETRAPVRSQQPPIFRLPRSHTACNTAETQRHAGLARQTNTVHQHSPPAKGTSSERSPVDTRATTPL